MSNSFSRAAAGLVLVALAAACDLPTAPSRNRLESSRNRLEIVSATAIAPQQTSEVQAFRVTANGAREDVTARVTWTTSDSAVLSVSTGGRVTGGAIGEATLRAMLDDVSASTTVIVVPAGTFRLAGIVRASGSTSPVAGAQIQLITASGDVLTTQAAGPAGFRFYGVAGRARIRISRPGFQPYEAEIDIHDHLTHDVSLSPIDVTGTYRLTLSVSNRCPSELPEAMRTRTYDAIIEQVDGSLLVRVLLKFAGWENRFTGVFGETDDVVVELNFEDWWVEEGPVREFHASGRMTATISAGGLSGFLDGDMAAVVDNEDGRGNHTVRCTAPNHRVMFSR